MPGHLIHAGAAVACAHGGQAMPTVPQPRVTVSGQPVVGAAAPYTVTGCPFAPPQGNGPCVGAQWVSRSLRVRAGGVPLVLSDSGALCTPTGTPLTVTAHQTRVRGV